MMKIKAILIRAPYEKWETRTSAASDFNQSKAWETSLSKEADSDRFKDTDAIM